MQRAEGAGVLVRSEVDHERLVGHLRHLSFVISVVETHWKVLSKKGLWSLYFQRSLCLLGSEETVEARRGSKVFIQR